MAGGNAVLIADDDARVREICGTALRHAGYEVIEAVDGEEALSLARRHRPDLVILDLKMPRMDGWTAMERMRADPDLTGTIIVTLTIIGPGEDRRDPIRRGFDGHYTKPMALGRLVRMVQRWIGPACRESPGPA